MNCRAVEFGDIAEKYVLGRLSEPQATEFEEHFFVCPRCLEEVRVWQAAKQAQPTAGRRPAGSPYVWAAAAAAVAAIALLAVNGGVRIGRPSAPAPVARVESPSEPDPLALLARVDPPPYAAPVLRGTANEAARQFRDAMQHYGQRDYAAAADGLTTSLGTNPEAMAPHFYLGICDLMLDRTDDAISELRRVESAGQTIYRDEARFFLAKALLAKRDVAGATAALERVAAAPGDRQAEAIALLEQLRTAVPSR